MIKKLWNLWKAFGEKLSIVVNTILLSAVYIVIVTPIALLRKAFVKKPKHQKTFWQDFNQEDSDEEIRRQF